MICPICRQPTSWEGNVWRPFCSERCQVTDLGTWASEGYRLPGSPLTTDSGISEFIKEDPKTGTD
ncbi:MAG TPA: DNA gyrase inhibitor YacG [Nitrospira sp.]|nr:DNA gyrase inhibitor YacG [Nitrospira sp.]